MINVNALVADKTASGCCKTRPIPQQISAQKPENLLSFCLFSPTFRLRSLQKREFFRLAALGEAQIRPAPTRRLTGASWDLSFAQVIPSFHFRSSPVGSTLGNRSRD